MYKKVYVLVLSLSLFFIIGTTKLSADTKEQSMDFKGNPDRFTLNQNYPNPFNPSTSIRFQVPLNKGGFRGLSVQLTIYDILGKEVEVLVNEQLQPGTYSVEWNASNFASGIYFYSLTAGDFIQTRKMVLIK